MRENLLKPIIAIILIITLTMANFVLLGVSAVSYAADEINKNIATNNENVTFNSYFKNESKSTVGSKEEKMNSNDIRLYMQISVKNEGYFNGKITLGDSNFKLKEEVLSSGINKIEGNTIILNQINSSKTVEIEVGIEPVKEDKINTGLLNMTSNVVLSGTYKDSSEKDIKIESTRQVQLILTNPYEDNKGAEASCEILTNKVYAINGENKRIVQVLINSGISENAYPIKSTNLEVSVPDGVEKVETISRGTIATNGKPGELFTKSNWSYDESSQKVNIVIANNEENGKISWAKDKKDQVIVTYIMSEDTNITNTEINVKNAITLYDTKGTVKNAEATTVVSEEKDGIITNEINAKEASIYKGKIYSGEERNYNTTANIYVNNSETGKSAVAELGASTYETETGSIDANAQYVSTTVHKAQVLKVLGENGELRVLNTTGALIASITNKTETDENGNVVINYAEGTKTVKIETTKAMQVGTIELNNAKVIKSSNYERATILTAKEIKEIITGAETKIALNETKTEATLEINRTSLSTMNVNTGVEIRATLKTNSEENDLYKNPTIKIALPSQVERVNVNSISLLYEDELKVATANTHEENGVKVIEVALTGEETKHKEGTIEGATLIVNADLEVNKKATNSNENIKMTIVNPNSGAQLEIDNEITIVSPRGIVTINSINDYGMSVIGEEETQTAKLEIGLDAKQTAVEIEIINNNESAINNVKVMGDFPTKNEKNTMDSSVSTLNISRTDAAVYYTENENATDNLEDVSNGWSKEFKDGAKVKKYLVVIESMDVAEDLKASYTLNIPEGLEYNVQAYEGYKVIYTDSNTNITSEIVATTLGLSTGKGPELTTKLTAKVGSKQLQNGETIKQGEVVKYELELENTGTENATNVEISGAIPEGTKQVREATAEEDPLNTYKELDGTEFKTSVNTIAQGEKKTVEYEVKVSSDIQNNQEITNQMNVGYNSLEAETDKITLNAQKSDLSIEVRNSKYLQDGTKFLPGETIDYYAIITNLSDKKIEDIKLNWNVPQKTEISYQERVYNFGEANESVEQLKTSSTVTISEVEANSVAVVRLSLKISDNIESTEKLNVSAVVSSGETQTESNEIDIIVYGTENVNISLTANKENGYLVDGDKVQYKIVATNNNEIAINGALITDKIPKELTILSVTVNGEARPIDEITDNNIKISKDLASGESVEVIITAIVNYDETRLEATTITNKAELMITSQMTKTSEEVSHILIASSSDIVDAKNMISGVAWFDENKDGQRDSSEKLLEGITVRLIDVTTGNIAKSHQDEDLVTTTNSKGLYIFSNVPNGEYIVAFEYDTGAYVVTAYQKEGVPETNNSDAITQTLTIGDKTGTYAVTDSIAMGEQGISNIDLGLITSTTFDLELNKYVSKIVVQNSKGTNTYEYNKSNLAKVEIAAKMLSGSTVIIEYQIDVTNAGELAGYAKNIADYMPSDLKFSSELNTDWYQSGDSLYNTSLANTKLEPGETKTLKLTLTKTMTEENTGLVNNTAEITESYNESGLKDLDSTAGNKVQGEDDMGAADVIIGVKTGAMITYIGLTISIMVLIAIGAYHINRKILKKHEIKVNL